jgi:hypothetical protein
MYFDTAITFGLISRCVAELESGFPIIFGTTSEPSTAFCARNITTAVHSWAQAARKTDFTPRCICQSDDQFLSSHKKTLQASSRIQKFSFLSERIISERISKTNS